MSHSCCSKCIILQEPYLLFFNCSSNILQIIQTIPLTSISNLPLPFQLPNLHNDSHRAERCRPNPCPLPSHPGRVPVCTKYFTLVMDHQQTVPRPFRTVPLILHDAKNTPLAAIIQNNMSLLREHGIICIRGAFEPGSISPLENESLSVLITQRLGSLQRENRMRLRQMNGLTLWLTSRCKRTNEILHQEQPGFVWRDRANDPTAYQNLISQYEEFCETMKNSIQCLNHGVFNTKICLICGKSIKRMPKIRCWICLRQFHLPCLADAPVNPEHVPWYCDHCICYPMEVLPCKTNRILNWNQLVEEDQRIIQKFIVPNVHAENANDNETYQNSSSSDSPTSSASLCTVSLSDEALERLYLSSINDEGNYLEVFRASITFSASTELLLAEPLVDNAANLLRNHPDTSSISGPWLTGGTTFSTHEWHVEEYFLFSASLLREGKPKCWYSVPHSHFSQMKQCMQETVPQNLARLVPEHFHMLDPKSLPSGIPVYRCVQQPGDLIICYPKAFHCSFSLGIHVSEVANFALEEWTAFAPKELEEYLQ